MATTTPTRRTPLERLFGRPPAPPAPPQADPGDPDVQQCARRLGIPTREIAEVRDHPQGRIARTVDTTEYIVLDDDQFDTRGQTGVLLYAGPDGHPMPRGNMGRYRGADTVTSSPWSGVSFEELALEAQAVSVDLERLRSGREVEEWIAGDPVAALAFWAARAKQRGLDPADAVGVDSFCGWCRDLLLDAGVTDVP